MGILAMGEKEKGLGKSPSSVQQYQWKMLFEMEMLSLLLLSLVFWKTAFEIDTANKLFTDVCFFPKGKKQQIRILQTLLIWRGKKQEFKFRTMQNLMQSPVEKCLVI